MTDLEDFLSCFMGCGCMLLSSGLVILALVAFVLMVRG